MITCQENSFFEEHLILVLGLGMYVIRHRSDRLSCYLSNPNYISSSSFRRYSFVFFFRQNVTDMSATICSYKQALMNRRCCGVKAYNTHPPHSLTSSNPISVITKRQDQQSVPKPSYKQALMNHERRDVKTCEATLASSTAAPAAFNHPASASLTSAHVGIKTTPDVKASSSISTEAVRKTVPDAKTIDLNVQKISMTKRKRMRNPPHWSCDRRLILYIESTLYDATKSAKCNNKPTLKRRQIRQIKAKARHEYLALNAKDREEYLAIKAKAYKEYLAIKWHELADDTYCFHPCKGWDGKSDRCQCGNYRVYPEMLKYWCGDY
jgi:hypothetical protein